MDLLEIKKMGNHELLIRFSGLCHILGTKDVLCQKVDDDLYLDIKSIENEILERMNKEENNVISTN